MFWKSFFPVIKRLYKIYSLQKKLFQKIAGFDFSTLHHELYISGTCCNYLLCSSDTGESICNNWNFFEWPPSQLWVKWTKIVLPMGNLRQKLVISVMAKLPIGKTNIFGNLDHENQIYTCLSGGYCYLAPRGGRFRLFGFQTCLRSFLHALTL